MKKLFVLTLGIAAMLFVLAPIGARAAAEKTAVCHVNSANDTVGPLTYGRVIEVAGNAVPAHLAHGDATRFYDDSSIFGRILLGLGDVLGLTVNANCAFFD